MAELTGKVTAVLPMASGVSKRTGSEWVSQEYVIEEQGVSHPQRVCIKLLGRDRIEMHALQVGDMVTARLELRCREYEGKWYNEVYCWSVERLDAAQPQPQPQQMQYVQQPAQPQYTPQQPQQGYVQPQAFTPPTVDQYGNPIPPQGGYQQAPQPQGNELPF